MITENAYTGETIDFLFEGDETFNFGASGTQPFKVFVYPDGTDVETSDTSLVKTIDSRDTEKDITHGQGFVEKSSEENLAHCILPYYVTQNMKTGSYTVELLYGTSRRSVFMRNNAFVLNLGYSKNVD